MEVDFDVVCAIVAVPLCMALLALLSLCEFGAALMSCHCGDWGE
jgi:hypothetical protein